MVFFKKVLIAYIVVNKYKHYILYILLEKAGMLFGITHIFKYLLYFIYDLAGIMLKSYHSIDTSKSFNSKMKIMNDKFVGRRNLSVCDRRNCLSKAQFPSMCFLKLLSSVIHVKGLSVQLLILTYWTMLGIIDA